MQLSHITVSEELAVADEETARAEQEIGEYTDQEEGRENEEEEEDDDEVRDGKMEMEMDEKEEEDEDEEDENENEDEEEKEAEEADDPMTTTTATQTQNGPSLLLPFPYQGPQQQQRQQPRVSGGVTDIITPKNNLQFSDDDYGDDVDYYDSEIEDVNDHGNYQQLYEWDDISVPQMMIPSVNHRTGVAAIDDDVAAVAIGGDGSGSGGTAAVIDRETTDVDAFTGEQSPSPPSQLLFARIRRKYGVPPLSAYEEEKDDENEYRPHEYGNSSSNKSGRMGNRNNRSNRNKLVTEVMDTAIIDTDFYSHGINSRSSSNNKANANRLSKYRGVPLSGLLFDENGNNGGNNGYQHHHHHMLHQQYGSDFFYPL